jgi:hypothetical protein
MISRSQQIALKRAQAEAHIDDVEYRDTLELLTGIDGCRSSKHPGLTDEHWDRLIAYMEAIFWRNVDAGLLQPSGKPKAMFRQRHFWSSRNFGGSNSRERYTSSSLDSQIEAVERELAGLGFGPGYFAGIRRRVGAASKFAYLAALQRTLKAKRPAELVAGPF